MFLLLRDCLVREEDGKLVIGSGVPEAWLTNDFSVENMPTYFGPVSFRYTASDRMIRVSGADLDEVLLEHEMPDSNIKVVADRKEA